MIISLIGMSGSGKTYWSKELSQVGFKHLCCDDLIEEKLSDELKKLGYKGIADVSRWMGQPYDGWYKKASETYLKLENEVVAEFLQLIRLKPGKKIVLDTTGSLIYLNQSLLGRLKKLTKVIYLEVPQEVKDEMFELYVKDPKPVIWGRSFKKRNKESDVEALKKCYPGLLEFRSKSYKKFADVIVDYHQLRDDKFDTTQFLKLVSK